MNEYQRTEAYNTYVTDSLKLIYEGFAKVFGGEVDMERYYDIVHQKPVNETRTEDEIIASIRNKLNGG